MGLMELPRTEPGQLLITPHPMLLDGQRSVVWEAQAGESLYALLTCSHLLIVSERVV